MELIERARNGMSWSEYMQTMRREDLLAIIKSTNPNGALRLARIAAMEEWDHRYPVGAR